MPSSMLIFTRVLPPPLHQEPERIMYQNTLFQIWLEKHNGIIPAVFEDHRDKVGPFPAQLFFYGFVALCFSTAKGTCILFGCSYYFLQTVFENLCFTFDGSR